MAEDAPALAVCDACWTAAEADLVAAEQHTEQPLTGEQAGELHPFDALLVRAGLRWQVLRWIVPSNRRTLAGQVAQAEATPPANTRPADSGRLWLDQVQAMLVAAGFRRDRARNILAVAEGFVALVEREGRPVTWVTQAELAAQAGVTERTVRAHVAWLRGVGLLHELVGGTRALMMSRPEDETPAEAETRREAEQVAQAAEESRIAHARTVLANRRERAAAELSAVRDGHSAAEAAQLALEAVPAVEIPEEWGGASRPLVNLAPVYELRVPLTPAEVAERSAVTSADTRNFRPPSLSLERESPEQSLWINRGASRRSDKEGVGQPRAGAELRSVGLKGTGEGDRPGRPVSRAYKAAEALVRSLLRPEVAEGLTVRWVAGQLRRSGLLEAGWTHQDLADQVHGLPYRPHLPRHIANTRGWVRASLQRATPALPPSRLAAIAEAEAHAPHYWSEVAAKRQRAETASRRAVIDGCPLCDELGWIEIDDPAVVAVRCNHDPDTGGW